MDGGRIDCIRVSDSLAYKGAISSKSRWERQEKVP